MAKSLGKHLVEETEDGRWHVIPLPDGFKDGDPLPAPSRRERTFDTMKEAGDFIEEDSRARRSPNLSTTAAST